MSRSTRFTAVSLILALAMAAVALAAGPGLSSHLLRAGEQPGYSVTKGTHRTQHSVAAFLSFSGSGGKSQAAYARELKADRFKEATEEQLHGSQGRQGFSLVMLLGTASGAKRAAATLLAHAAHSQLGTSVSYFRVTGVPTARGVQAGDGRFATANAYWTLGRCALGSGLLLQHARKLSRAAIAQPVIAGIRAQHAHLHGRCG